jgi:hypothetical protein
MTSWYLPGEIKEDHKEPQFSGVTLEPTTARISSSCTTYSSSVMLQKNTLYHLECLVARPDGNFVWFCHLMGSVIFIFLNNLPESWNRISSLKYITEFGDDKILNAFHEWCPWFLYVQSVTTSSPPEIINHQDCSCLQRSFRGISLSSTLIGSLIICRNWTKPGGS